MTAQPDEHTQVSRDPKPTPQAGCAKEGTWQYFNWPNILSEARARLSEARANPTRWSAENIENLLEYWCAWAAHANAAACFSASPPLPVAEREWLPIESAFTDKRVTAEQRTLFVARFGHESQPSYNAVYLHGDYADGGIKHPWRFADGGGAYHRDWPTHWMFAADAAPAPPLLAEQGGKS